MKKKIVGITNIKQIKGIGKKVVKSPKLSKGIKRALAKRIRLKVPQYGEKQNILTYPENLGYRL